MRGAVKNEDRSRSTDDALPDLSATSVRRRGADALRATVKRAIDVVVAGVLLVVLAPVLVAIALLVVLDSRGPVLYRAERVGFRGRRLRMLKFRKMFDHTSGSALTTSGDARLTRVGAVLARTRLDELPQLWHVVTGEMSFIGPRPEEPRFVDLHADDFARIVNVRPGITGWSQLAFAQEPSILRADDPEGHYVEAILPQKVGLDQLYAEQVSLRCDARIATATAATMLLRQPVAVHRETGALSWRRRLAERPVPQPAARTVPEPIAAPSGLDHEVVV